MMYFNGGDGKPIQKGDRCRYGNDNETVWIIMRNPTGLSIYDSTHPDSDYMSVWAKPEDCKSDTYTSKWIRGKTKAFIKIIE